jgi:outer membrane protein OmpA-like peptidoglycan-associated protein
MNLRYLLACILTSSVLRLEAQTQSCSIYFESGSSALVQEQQSRLDSLISLFRKGSVVSAVISGHCDSIGSEESNQLLSEQRVLIVVNYFRSAMDSFRFQQHAYGETKPVSPNSSESGRQLNRRVEIRFSIKAEKKEKSPALSEREFKLGESIILTNMNFEGGLAVLLPQSLPAVEELFEVLRTHPSMKIEIAGHVCCYHDYSLSVARAMKICILLMQKGIDGSRLCYEGYGYWKPIASDQTEAGRIKNRRVEIKILAL